MIGKAPRTTREPLRSTILIYSMADDPHLLLQIPKCMSDDPRLISKYININNP